MLGRVLDGVVYDYDGMPCFHHPDEIRMLRSFSVRSEELGVCISPIE